MSNEPLTVEKLRKYGLMSSLDESLTDIGRDVAENELLYAYKNAGYQNDKYIIRKLKTDGLLLNIGGRITVSREGEECVIRKWKSQGLNDVAFDKAVEELTSTKKAINDPFNLTKAKGNHKHMPVTKVANADNSAAFDFVGVKNRIDLPKYKFIAGREMRKLDLPKQYGSVPEQKAEQDAGKEIMNGIMALLLAKGISVDELKSVNGLMEAISGKVAKQAKAEQEVEKQSKQTSANTTKVVKSTEELEKLVADMKSKPDAKNKSTTRAKKGTPARFDNVPEVEKEDKPKKASPASRGKFSFKK